MSLFYTERAVEEEEARELSPNLMENADADPAMEAKEEEDAQTEEEAAALLEVLRSLVSEGQYPLFIKKSICHVHARKPVIPSCNQSDSL